MTYCPHFADEETEAQRGEATCPRSHSGESVAVCFFSKKQKPGRLKFLAFDFFPFHGFLSGRASQICIGVLHVKFLWRHNWGTLPSFLNGWNFQFPSPLYHLWLQAFPAALLSPFTVLTRLFHITNYKIAPLY